MFMDLFELSRFRSQTLFYLFLFFFGGEKYTFPYTVVHRLAPVISAFFFFGHSLSLPVTVFVSLIPFHCFTQKSIYSTKGHNLSNHYITKTRLFKYIENFITKNWKCSDKNFWYFHISAQNIDCGYSLEPPLQGGSNKYPQSMFLSRNKKNNVYPCKPQFYYIKVGFKGVKII